MYPDQQNQNGYPPQPSTSPQQTPDGQYTVLPPINNGARTTGHNPYEFIMAPNNQKKRVSLSLGGASFGKQIALLAGGALLLIAIMAVVFSLLSPKSSTPGLIAIAQRQQEILRITSDTNNKINDQAISNLIINTRLSVTTDQTAMLNYLGTHGGTKISPKVLALDHSLQTDQLLAAATSAGNYGSTVAQTLKSELTTYQSLLQTTYKQTTSTAAKQLLEKDFNNATALLDQAKNVTAPASGS